MVPFNGYRFNSIAFRISGPKIKLLAHIRQSIHGCEVEPFGVILQQKRGKTIGQL